MLDIIKTQLKPSMPLEQKKNLAREFLQVLILKVIYDNGFFKYFALTGGTALRILHKIRRFSEDLGFSAIIQRAGAWEDFAWTIENSLARYTLAAEVKSRQVKTVKSLEVRFNRLLFDLGISPLKDEKLMIRCEADTNPPQGGRLELSLVNELSLILTVTHFDLSSMYATKLHACFYRSYTKGRDFYDLIWYLSKNIEPNFVLLNNAIKQTQHTDPKIHKNNFKDFLLKKIEEVDFKAAKKDVERFLFDKNDLKLFDAGLFKKTIEKTL